MDLMNGQGSLEIQMHSQVESSLLDSRFGEDEVDIKSIQGEIQQTAQQLVVNSSDQQEKVSEQIKRVMPLDISRLSASSRASTLKIQYESQDQLKIILDLVGKDKKQNEKRLALKRMVFLEDSRDWDTFLNFTQMDRSRLVTMKNFIEGCLI